MSDDGLPDDIEALAALAGARQVRTPDEQLYREDFGHYFNRWLEENNISPGAFHSLSSGDLYRHFRFWLDSAGSELPDVHFRGFGRALMAAGLHKGRSSRTGRDCRPYMMCKAAADYLRKWGRENPGPGVNEGPFQNKVNLRRKARKDGNENGT